MSNLNEYQDLIPSLKQVIFQCLEPQQDERFNFDDRLICDEIIRFIFRNKPLISDNDRYEWLSMLQTKASMIAQGWKINCAANVRFRDESMASISAYLHATYGVPHSRYAA